MKIDLSQPAPRVKTLEEAQGLIDLLWLLLREQAQRIEVQAKQIEAQAKRIQVLEEKLHADSRNSSQPPSVDQNKARRKPHMGSGRKAGGQPGHAGKGRPLLAEDQVTTVIDCHPQPQCACGGAIQGTTLIQRHQVVEMPPVTPLIAEYRLYAGTCCACGRLHMAALPAGVPTGCMGPRLLALIGTLGAYRLSKRQMRDLLHDVFHIDLSVGTISRSEARLSAVLAPIAQQAHQAVQQAPVVYADETSHKEKGKLQWMWLAIAGRLAVFLARASRGAQAAQELLGKDFAGMLVSDRYAGYNWVQPQRRQVCWAHLLRDFTKIAERDGAVGRIGQELLAHARRMFYFLQRVRDGTLSRDSFAMHMWFLRWQIEAALQRGSACGEIKTANTCRRLLNCKEALWTFISTSGVEPTNNLCERTLRGYVIWRKISFGTQSLRGSVYIERLMTIVASCRLQGRNVLQFMTQAVLAQLHRQGMPSLVQG